MISLWRRLGPGECRATAAKAALEAFADTPIAAGLKMLLQHVAEGMSAYEDAAPSSS